VTERMRDIRMATEAELDRWEAQAIAIGAHLDIGPAESQQRVETHRRLVHAAASRIRRLVGEADGVSPATRTRLEVAFQQLRTALAAASAGPSSTFSTEASEIAEAVKVFEEALDHAAEEGGDDLTEDLGILARDFVGTTDAFAAELAAARWSLSCVGDGDSEERQRRKQELQRDSARLCSAIGDARLPLAGDCAAANDLRVATDIARLRQTFLRVVAP
jgi:hypothetical protein